MNILKSWRLKMQTVLITKKRDEDIDKTVVNSLISLGIIPTANIVEILSNFLRYLKNEK